MPALQFDWERDEQALAAIYGAFDVLYDLAQTEAFGAGDPRIASVDRLLESFERVLGNHLPPGLDPTIGIPVYVRGLGQVEPDEPRLPYPWFDFPGEDELDDVMSGAAGAATSLLERDPKLAAALDPQVPHPPWRRRRACDRLVRAALEAGLHRARTPFDERTQSGWPAAPPRPERTRIDHLDAEISRGYLYGLVDGADLRLYEYASYDGWEVELAADYEHVFGQPLPQGTFSDLGSQPAVDDVETSDQDRLSCDGPAYEHAYWQGQEIGEQLLGINASLFMEAGGDFDRLDSFSAMIPADQLARRILNHFAQFALQ